MFLNGNMKKIKNKFILYLMPLFILVLSSVLFLCPWKTAAAEAYSSTYISGYDITYDIHSDRTIDITEDITLSFYGDSGFIRDIPVNGGEKVMNVKVYQLNGQKETHVYYEVFSEDPRFISIDIGDYSRKYSDFTYRIKYTYCMTKAQEGEDLLALTPVGAGWGCAIENVKLKLILPDGYVEDSVKCFTSINSTAGSLLPVNTSSENGRTVITAEAEEINGEFNECLRVDLGFKEGTLTTFFDFTPYWYIIIGAVLHIFIIDVKILFFNKRKILPVVNFEAPDEMSPLLMGKLIDNTVNADDITSMIYYWADKGYIKINLDDKDEPTLIRIYKSLPAQTPEYEKTLFDEMFRKSETVKPSDLKYNFYTTIQKVKKQINTNVKGLYDGKGFAVSAVLAIFGALLTGLAPFIIAFTQISYTYILIAHFLSVLPLIAIYALCLAIKYNVLKLNATKKALYCLGAAGVWVLFAVIYILAVPSFIIALLPKILICLVSGGAVICSVLIISRTEKYTEQLNGIIGFRNFITLAEKDRLEKMLEEDPQLYYHVLPYAQVLGVSDKWEEKFAQITIEPPRWATGSLTSDVLSFYLINKMIRSSAAAMTSNMVARPSSSGLSGGSGGGFGGGSFGGFSGGGHGGGGGRFR